MLSDPSAILPHTPAVNGPSDTPPSMIGPVKSNAAAKGIPVIPINGILSAPSFPTEVSSSQSPQLVAEISAPPGFDKPNWEVLLPKKIYC